MDDRLRLKAGYFVHHASQILRRQRLSELILRVGSHMRVRNERRMEILVTGGGVAKLA
jgi:hypothetical protein